MAMATVDLREAAAAEAARVMRARAIRRDGDDRALTRLESDGTWITRARRAKTRRVLGRRALLVWRVTAEDAGGRTLESLLVAVAVQLADRRSDLSIPQLELVIQPCVEAAACRWHESAARIAHAFASARIARESAIAGDGAGNDRAYQPGLFDSRAERERAAAASTLAGADLEAANRLASIERRSTVRRRPARLLLVLLP